MTVSSPQHSASEFPSCLCPDLGFTLLAAWFESAQLQLAFLGCMEEYLPSFLFKKKKQLHKPKYRTVRNALFLSAKDDLYINFFFHLAFSPLCTYNHLWLH